MAGKSDSFGRLAKKGTWLEAEVLLTGFVFSGGGRCDIP
jgi:hypothetical protein